MSCRLWSTASVGFGQYISRNFHFVFGKSGLRVLFAKMTSGSTRCGLQEGKSKNRLTAIEDFATKLEDLFILVPRNHHGRSGVETIEPPRYTSC